MVRDVADLARVDRRAADPGIGAEWLGMLARSWPRRPCVAVMLSTAMAARPGVARALACRAVTAGLPDRRAGDFEIVLSEALANAVVHGNLDIPGLAASGASIDGYYERIEARLADPAWSSRPIRIVLGSRCMGTVVHVDDVGRGWDRRLRVPQTALGGRGLTLMNRLGDHLRLSRGGRRISVGFRHAA